LNSLKLSKKNLLYGLGVVEKANPLIFLSGLLNSKKFDLKYSMNKIKEGSVKILINIFLFFFF
jgi:hypothetical protein